jgi:type IV secretion system protein VirB3
VSLGLERDTLFVGLTRPQMFAGVTYSLFVTNVVIATELFLIFKSIWVIAVALLLHGLAMLLCLKEPRFFDLWLARVSKCPRIKNYRVWGCNSYRP